jgi:hypothetical protein
MMLGVNLIAQQDKIAIYSRWTTQMEFRTASASGWQSLSVPSLETSSGSTQGRHAMKLLFSGRNAKLEMMNRILTDAARKRTERVEELERQVAQLQQELEPARKAIERVRELEAVAAHRAHLVMRKIKNLRLYAKLSPSACYEFKSWNTL